MTPPDTPPVLIAYDGSAPARRAVEEAAILFPGATAVVVTVWRSAGDAAAIARAGMPEGIRADAVRTLDRAEEEAASATAAGGADAARTAGLDASPLVLRAAPSVWGSVVRLADEHAARAVVVGSRGRSGLHSALLGSVSNAVVHHCRRPVVVVHPDADA